MLLPPVPRRMDHPLYEMMACDDEAAAPHAAKRRHGSDGDTGNSSGSNSDSGVLRDVLALCGVSSASPDPPPAPLPPFVLSHPPHRIRLILEHEMPKSGHRADQFMAELTELCSEATQLRRFLSPSVVPSLPPPPRTVSLPPLPPLGPSQQDSLIRICLCVLSLQRPLIDWLLEQLVANEDEWLSAAGIRSSILSQRGLASQSLPASTLPRLLLDQLRMLDVVFDSDALCSKVAEVVEALSTVKAELILALPDILTDPCYHDRVADCLIAQLRVSDALLLPVLDCLSRLSLTSRQKERTVEAVRPLVASVKERSLPALIRFLLQMTSENSVTDILDTIRLHLPQLAEDNGSNDSSGGKGGKEEREQQEVSGAVLIVDALRSGLQLNQLACKAYLELLKADGRECKVADVLILFIVHSLPHNRQLSQRAVDVLCKKLLSGLLSSAMLHSSLVSHVSCVRPMFDSVAALAELMVRKQADRAVRETGGCMQVDLFLAFDDRAQRMTIAQSWLQQLGSREPVEMDNALRGLEAVGRAKGGVRALAVFFEYLKTVLQYLDDYKLSQIRSLFQILATLAFKQEAVSHDLDDECTGGTDGSRCAPFDTSLQVFIQKELHAPSLRDQRIGIVAVVAFMAPIAAHRPRAEQRLDVQHQQRDPPDVFCSHLDQLFGSLVKCTCRSPSARSFLYDELSLALDSHRLLHIGILHRVHRYFSSHFQLHMFVPRAHGEHPLPLNIDRHTSQLMCKDQLAGPDLTANKAKLSFNITPTLLSPNRQLMTLPAELRLLAACYRADRPSDDFVQLLIAPFTLPAPLGRNPVDRIEQFKQQTAYMQCVLISSHFHAIQAMREVINAFSSPALQLDVRDREHLVPCLVHRMQQLLSMEDELRAMLKCVPDFTSQQLLSMADSTSESYIRDMATLDGTRKVDDSHHFTTLNGTPHTARQKKRRTVTRGKRKGDSDSGDEGSSSAASESDSGREEARRKRKGQAARRKESAADAKDEDKGRGPFDSAIRPLLRPLTLDVMQLLCNPLSKNLVLAAEAHRRQEQTTKQANRQQRGEVDHHSNMLLLYMPPTESADINLPQLSVGVLRFLLTELRNKMEAGLGSASSHTQLSTSVAKKAPLPAVLPSQQPAVDTPVSLVTVLSPVLRGVHDHYLVLSQFLNTSDVDDDDEVDRDELSACLIACVHVVHSIMNCSTLTVPAGHAALQSAILTLLGAVRQKSGSVATLSQIGEQSLTTLCDLLVNRLRGCLNSFRCINDAVVVVAVIRKIDSVRALLSADPAVSAASASDVKSARLNEISQKLLNKEWTSKVALRKHNVGELVSLLVRHAEDSLTTMNNIAPRMLALAQLATSKKKKKTQHGEDEKDDVVEDEQGGEINKRPYRQMLTKQTVPLWLLPMIDQSSRLLRQTDLTRLKSGSQYLNRLQQLVLLAADLLNIAKLYPRNLTLHKHCIRVALNMIDSFTRGLDGMGRLLQLNQRQRNGEAVKRTLSGMQQVTRAFNALCVHVKDQQAGSLQTLLPKAKMAYEQWLMAIKRFCQQHTIHFSSHTQHTQQHAMHRATAVTAPPLVLSVLAHSALTVVRSVVPLSAAVVC